MKADNQNSCFADPNSWMSQRRKACLEGNHVKRKWVKTGEDSHRLDHEATDQQADCIFCKYGLE